MTENVEFSSSGSQSENGSKLFLGQRSR